MKKNNNVKFLFYFYPEKDGKYTAFSPDFEQATGGKGKYQSERLAGDLVNGLLDLKEYKHLQDPSKRKKHFDINPVDLYYQFTGERLSEEEKKGVYYKYISPRVYYISE